MAAGKQHHLEFGGSPVTTEFPGQLRFKLVDRIPVLELSHDFDEEAARAVRYSLVATVGPERPFYQRYLDVVLDVRMVSAWKDGAGDFVAALRDRMKNLGGGLHVVATQPVPSSSPVSTVETPEEAIAAAKQVRQERRLKALQVQ